MKSVVFGAAPLVEIVLGLAVLLALGHAADHEAHRHSDEAYCAQDNKDDPKGRRIVLDRLNQLVLAVTVHRHSVTHIRKQVEVAWGAEARALEVSLEDLHDLVEFVALAGRGDIGLVGALV